MSRALKMSKKTGISVAAALEILENYTLKEITIGTGVFYNNGIVPGAYSVEPIPELCEFEEGEYEKAAKIYVQAGGAVINDIKTDIPYLDTVKNRKIVADYFNAHVSYSADDIINNTSIANRAPKRNRYRIICVDGFGMDLNVLNSSSTLCAVEIRNISWNDPKLTKFMVKSEDIVKEDEHIYYKGPYYVVNRTGLSRVLKNHKGFVKDLSEQRFFSIEDWMKSYNMKRNPDEVTLTMADGFKLNLLIDSGKIMRISPKLETLTLPKGYFIKKDINAHINFHSGILKRP